MLVYGIGNLIHEYEFNLLKMYPISQGATVEPQPRRGGRRDQRGDDDHHQGRHVRRSLALGRRSKQRYELGRGDGY